MISILIPAYNYAAGVRRIVAPILAEGRSDIEIVIHDDSSDNGVEVALREFTGSYTYLRYARNFPPLGAVQNWNGLLQSARGRYVILIHHDDFPLSETFATDLLNELEKHDWPDALILSILTYDVTRKKVMPGICNFFRSFIGRYLPTYMFRRNIIGPPSILVVRSDLFAGYDPALKWLVDVEAYFRFLTAQPRKLVFSPLMMASSTGLPNAISTTIKSGVKEITKNELAYLEAKYSRKSFWMQPIRNSMLGNFLLVSELTLWLIIRTASVFCSALGGGKSLSAAVKSRDKFSGPIIQKGKT